MGQFLLGYWIRSSMTMFSASSTLRQHKFWGERNFHELVLDCENRENFPQYGTLSSMTIVEQNKSVHVQTISLTSACCVHSNVNGLGNIH